MADIFSSQPGRVTAVVGTGLVMRLDIGQAAGPGSPDSRWQGFEGFRAIIQALGISGQGGFQLAHSLRDYIYVYVFGERAGEIQVSGLAFHSGCGDDGSSPTGLELVYAYYQRARITSNPLPVSIAIGGMLEFTAFLTGVNLGIVDPGTSMSNFALRFSYIPDQEDLIPDSEVPPGTAPADTGGDGGWIDIEPTDPLGE